MKRLKIQKTVISEIFRIEDRVPLLPCLERGDCRSDRPSLPSAILDPVAMNGTSFSGVPGKTLSAKNKQKKIFVN